MGEPGTLLEFKDYTKAKGAIWDPERKKWYNVAGQRNIQAGRRNIHKIFYVLSIEQRSRTPCSNIKDIILIYKHINLNLYSHQLFTSI